MKIIDTLSIRILSSTKAKQGQMAPEIPCGLVGCWEVRKYVS